MFSQEAVNVQKENVQDTSNQNMRRFIPCNVERRDTKKNYKYGFRQKGTDSLRNGESSKNQMFVNGNPTECNRPYKTCPKFRSDAKYGFKKIEELSQKDDTTIIVELTANTNSFEQLLETKISNDCLVLVVRILSKICATDLSTGKSLIISFASKESFHNSIKDFALNLTVQDSAERMRSSYFWKEPKTFFIEVSHIFKALIDFVPSIACEVLPKTFRSFNVLFTTLDNLVDQNVLQIFEDLKKMLEVCKQEKPTVNKSRKKIVEEELDSKFEPPDDFRELSVYPTRNDIHLPTRFLRKNLIDKEYESVDHYLDTQFRLLKEDFVGPLRNGITEFLSYDGPFKQIIKTSNVRVYTDVKFLSPKTIHGQIGVLLQFQKINPEKPLKIKFNKRFMYGSLLCFTSDKFETFLFGKVIERSTELLKEGQIIVGFEAGENNYVLEQSYIMIECSVYFEPYYHVLKALQNMRDDQFPMRKYIIDLNVNIDRISYLNLATEYKVDNHQLNVMNLDYWPSALSLRLNETQYEAFRSGLRNEFVVIQGPPGTGKTFLGLKIAETLIRNTTVWYNSSPILVVCYTNHALDQFLEGLRDFTSDIVRVGGQSKNPNMEKYSLREKRKMLRRNHYLDEKALSAVGLKTYNKLEEINNFNEMLKDIESNEMVIKFKNFSAIDEDLFHNWFSISTNDEMVEWLLGGRNAKRIWENNKQKLKQLVVKDLGLDEEFDEILYNQMRNEYELNLDEIIGTKTNKNYCLVSIQDMKSAIDKISAEETDNEESTFYDKYLQLQNKRSHLEFQLNHLQARLFENQNVKVYQKPTNCNLKNPHTMTSNERWQLYRYWLELYRKYITDKLVKLQNEYLELRNQYKELKDIFDLEIMKKMVIVGMTTTGAARLQTTLKKLESPIVIVEEAAEVLESHVVTCLTSACKHLILIGDHQQLRPSTSNYNIEKNFNLGISLFERMVRNNLQCHTLGVQHRMRPEFARLIVPAIYPKLENHHSVCNFPPVKGVVPFLYFIDHTMPEAETGDTSKMNHHEATFLIALARYLIQNGYKPEDVTILAAYSGQMFALWKEQKKCLDLLEGVRITVLDNYQGEESKIILLSLVRNNTENSIGFLKIENRVCVALSRAKEGFYMMGNMDLLCRNSDIWPKIRTELEAQNSLGKSLLLRCQIHVDKETEVIAAKDFINVPEGGCNNMCVAQLTCGHFCTMICHALDRKHVNFKCKAKCRKTLCENDHLCPDYCYKPCKPCKVMMLRVLPCSHEHTLYCHIDVNYFKCLTPVQITLPCGHTDPQIPCSLSNEKHICPFPCDSRVEPCGHACIRKCHFDDDPDHIEYRCPKPCTRPRSGCSMKTHKCPNQCYENCEPCEIVIKKKRSCTHIVRVPCNEDPNVKPCFDKCKRLIPDCGHACKQKCSDPCGACTVEVVKQIKECGHEIKIMCRESPRPSLCGEKCSLILPCGHVCKNKCNQTCTNLCNDLIDLGTVAACGHSFKIACHVKNKNLPINSSEVLKFCGRPCKSTLKCGHKCSGTCGECFQGRIHKACTEKCGATLVCGHSCPISCRESCQPCELPCSYRCQHSVCRKKCGEPCTMCQEECPRKCPHNECQNVCGDLCTIPPCSEPCPKELPCGHPCVGFCGDPCPTLCRTCNYDELTEIFFGDEDEESARFVLLEECKHLMESTGMDTWLQNQDEKQEIAPKCCPRCKTILSTTQRYGDYIKKALMNVSLVKEKYFGTSSENKERLTDLETILTDLKNERQSMNGTCIDKVLQTFNTSIGGSRVYRRQQLSRMLISIYLAKLQIIQNVVLAYKVGNFHTHKLSEEINFLFNRVTKNMKTQTEQEVLDFQREMKRLCFQIKLMKIQESGDFSYLLIKDSNFKNIYMQTKNVLFSIEVFADNNEKKVINNLDYLIKNSKIKLTPVEFQEVIQAMQMAKGHWFKCPNGHIYAIGECGGAMQVGKCADCGKRIGGTQHSLLTTNAHAGEVDGSNYAAYSEQANNLFNYVEFRGFR